MASEWRDMHWGDLAILEYGKGIRGYEAGNGAYRVFGTNGPIGYHDKALCPHPTVVIGRKGAYRGIHYSAEPCYVIDTAFYLQPRTEYDMRWAYYELLTHDINSMDSGSAIPSTSRDAFYRLPVRVPNEIQEQRAIAHILGMLDDKIELNRRMKEMLEEIARTLFKSWFADFDPVRAKVEGRDPGLPQHIADLFPSRFEDSEMGEIPKGWEVMPLDGIATYLNGLALQNYPSDASGSLPVIKIAQLRAGHTTGADQASIAIPSAYIVEDGDILFSWSGSLEVEVWCGGRGALNQHLFKITSDRFPKWFYLNWTRQHLNDFRGIASGKATTMGHIQRNHLSAAKVLVPPHPLLDAMSIYFEPLLTNFIGKGIESRTLAALRDTLLPKLISGELRLKDAERFARRVT